MNRKTGPCLYHFKLKELVVKLVLGASSHSEIGIVQGRQKLHTNFKEHMGMTRDKRVIFKLPHVRCLKGQSYVLLKTNNNYNKHVKQTRRETYFQVFLKVILYTFLEFYFRC